MSTNSLVDVAVRPPSDDVRVIVRGLVMVKIRETDVAHGEPGVAMIGALAPSPIPPPPIDACHQPVIQVVTIRRADGIVLAIQNFIPAVQQLDDFSLMTNQPEIKKAQVGAFNRLNDRHPKKDFRWFVDLDELHGKRITVNEDKLTPKLRMNRGLFHASDLSDGEVRKIVMGGPADGDRFGRFAMEITARVELNVGGTAEFKHGESSIFTVSKGDVNRYEIIYDARCRNNEDDSDFGLIYKVITNIGQPEQGSLPPDTTTLAEAEAATAQPSELTDELFAASPEVYCVAGYYAGT